MVELEKEGHVENKNIVTSPCSLLSSPTHPPPWFQLKEWPGGWGGGWGGGECIRRGFLSFGCISSVETEAHRKRYSCMLGNLHVHRGETMETVSLRGWRKRRRPSRRMQRLTLSPVPDLPPALSSPTTTVFRFFWHWPHGLSRHCSLVPSDPQQKWTHFSRTRSYFVRKVQLAGLIACPPFSHF